MASVRGPDQNQAISLSGSTLTLPASSISPIKCTIGGQQYISTANLSTTLSGLTVGTTYFVYLTLNGGSLVLLVSASTSSVLGTSNYKFVGGVIAYSATTGATIQSSDAAVNVVATQAYLTADQTGVNPNGTWVKLNLNAASIDKTGSFDSTNKRINISVSGTYDLYAMVNTSTTNVLANQYLIGIYKNGSLLKQGTFLMGTVSQNLGLSVGGTFDLITGDYLELYFWGAGNNSSSTLTVYGAVTQTVLSVSIA